jgi:hypothetical protein
MDSDNVLGKGTVTDLFEMDVSRVPLFYKTIQISWSKYDIESENNCLYMIDVWGNLVAFFLIVPLPFFSFSQKKKCIIKKATDIDVISI